MTAMHEITAICRREAMWISVSGAAVVTTVSARFGTSRALPALLYLAAVGVILAVVDLRTKRLPDIIVLPSYLIALGLLAAAGRDPLPRALLAMALTFVLYLILAVSNPTGLGFGDVKLSGLIGLYLGWFGWHTVLLGISAGFVLAAVTGLALIAAHRATRKTELPFGPFMLAGALLAVLI